MTDGNTKQIDTEEKFVEIDNTVEDATTQNVATETSAKEKYNDIKGLEKYYRATGRRKEAIARVRVLTKKASDKSMGKDKAIIFINDMPYVEYFKAENLQQIVEAPFRKLKSLTRFKATVKVKGGGIAGQADAIKHGLSRALVLFDQNFSKKLKKAGYMTRDSRVKERKKYGLKKARKSENWSKR